MRPKLFDKNIILQELDKNIIKNINKTVSKEKNFLFFNFIIILLFLLLFLFLLYRYFEKKNRSIIYK